MTQTTQWARDKALELVPPSWRGSIVTLREEIATALDQVPLQHGDMKILYEKCLQLKEDWEKTLKNLADEKRKYLLSQQDLTEKHKKLQDIISSVLAYSKWLDGEGDVTKNRELFANLETSVKRYLN